MTSKLEALQELHSRGKLPAEYKPLFEEAQRRGLLGETPKKDRFSGAGAFLTGAVEGVPIAGPYMLEGLQRAGAAGRTLRSGKPFAEELEAVRGQTDEAQAEHPWLTTGGNVTGAVAGLAPLVAAAPVAMGVRGATMIGRAGAGSASGAAIGAADSAARYGVDDPREIAKGAGFGAAGGLLAPYAGQGIGSGVRRGLDMLTRPSGPLSSVSRGAANYAANTVPDAGRMSQLQAEMSRFGPQGTLADVSPEWMGVARGAAARPGQRDQIVNFFNERTAGANQRLRGDLDASLGPVQNPTTIEAQIASAQEGLGPQYGQAFRGAQAVNTQSIADDLDTLAVELRGPAQQAVQRVRGYLNIPGERVLDPSPRALFETRQAIDGLLATETNPKVIRELTRARQSIDAEVARAVPGVKDVDAQFAELARQREGLQRGSQVLDSGKTAIRPEDLAAELQQSSLPQGMQVGPSAVPARVREGTRAEIDRIAGVNSNDPAALQRTVKGEGDWNREKLRTVFGPRADDALGAIDRETTFYRTGNRVTSGSDTAMGAGFRDFLNEVGTPNKVPADVSILGALLRGAQGAGNKLMGRNAAASADRFANELGGLSIAQGPQRDALIRALQDYASQRSAGQPAAEKTRALVQLLLMGSGQAAY